MAVTSVGAVGVDVQANPAGLTQSLNNAAAKIGSSFKGMVTGALKLFAVKEMGEFTGACINAAASAQQTANKVNAVFPEMNKTIDAFSSNAIEKMGITGGAAKRLTSSFGMMAQGMGFTEKQSAQMGMQMTQLAGDMAAFYGITTEEAQSKLTGIYTGMTRGMKTLGVNMSEANLEAHALSLGIHKAVAEMSQAELAALRYSYAQQQLAKVSGYAEKNLQTYNGQTQKLRQQITALTAQLGKPLIAALTPLVRFLNIVIGKILQVAQAFNALIERIIGRKLVDVIGGASGVVMDLADVSDDAADSTSGLVDAQTDAANAAKAQNKAQKELNKTLAGFDKINKLSSNSDDLGAVPSAALSVPSLTDGIDLGNFFTEQAQQAQSALDAITLPKSLETAVEKLAKSFGRLGEDIREGLGWVWENVLAPFGTWLAEELSPRVIELLANAFDTLAIIGEKLAPIFEFIWQEVFAPLFSFIGDRVLDVLDAMNIAWGDFNNLLDEADFTQFIEALKEFKETNPAAFDLIAGAITAIVLALTGHPILAILTAVAFVAKTIYENWDEIAAFFENIGKSIVDAFTGLAAGVSAKFQSAKDAAASTWQNVSDWFGKKRDEITSKFNGMAANIGGAFRAAREKIQEVWGNLAIWLSEKRDNIVRFYSNIPTALYNIFRSAYTMVTSAFGSISSWFSTKRNQITDVFRNIPTWFSNVFQNAKNAIQNKFANWGAFWSNVWNNIKSRFTNMGAALGNTMTSYIKAGMNKVIAGIESRINWAIDLLNNAIDLINAIPGVWIRWYINRLNLPRLAQGGFVPRNSPQLAVIGDNTREGEIVAPESKLQAMANQAAQGNMNAEVVALLKQLIAAVQDQDTATYLDGQEITRNVVANINRQTQASGRCPILV